MSATSPVSSEPSAEGSVYYFGFSYLTLGVDLVARYLLLAAWRYIRLPAWAFWLGHVLLGGAILMVCAFREHRLRAKYSIPRGTRLEPKPGSWIAVCLVLCVNAGYQTFMTLRFEHTWLRVVIGVALTLVVSIYYFIVALASHSERGILHGTAAPYDIPSDENDRVLIRLRTELATQERRIESYTVESTLIGALAFSAFVTIVSSEKIRRVKAIAEAAQDLSQAVASLVSLHLLEAKAAFAKLCAERPVLAIVAALSLTCSTFFIAVIVARLRFNSLIGLANYSIEVASALNQKEDDLFLHQLSLTQPRADLEERLFKLRERIHASLEEAQLISQQLSPIVLYMTVFDTSACSHSSLH